MSNEVPNEEGVFIAGGNWAEGLCWMIRMVITYTKQP